MLPYHQWLKCFQQKLKLLIHSQISMAALLALGKIYYYIPSLYWECDYLFMLGLNLIYVIKMDPKFYYI